MNKSFFISCVVLLVLGSAHAELSADIATISGLNSLSSLWKQTAKEEAHKALANPVPAGQNAATAPVQSAATTPAQTAATTTTAAGASVAEQEAQNNLVKYRALRKQLLVHWTDCLEKSETVEHVGVEVASCQPLLSNGLKAAQLIKEVLTIIKTEQEKRTKAATPQVPAQGNDMAAILARLNAMK